MIGGCGPLQVNPRRTPRSGRCTAEGSRRKRSQCSEALVPDQSGENLFLLGAVLDTSINTVTDNLGALAVASGGALTEPTTGITFATPGYWAVTDPK